MQVPVQYCFLILLGNQRHFKQREKKNTNKTYINPKIAPIYFEHKSQVQEQGKSFLPY